MTDMHYWSATETLQRFKDLEVSPVEVLDAVSARIETLNEDINAFSEQLLDDAYEAARAAEKRYAARMPSGPLDGLLVAAKDEHSIAGRTCTAGSMLLDGEIAEQTHPVVERVRNAGGIVHARTTMPEFALVPFTHSEQWGVTRNPWNRDLSPGGSSGGSAAALAAGMATLATGSDIGGSIRIPASFCGLVGFKPPHGRVPTLPPTNLDTYCADGPLGRTVADVAMLQNVLAGPHLGDRTSLSPKYLLPDRFEGVRGMRVALCVGLGDYLVDASVATSTRRAGTLLEQAGAIVEEVTLPWTVDAILGIAWAHMGRSLAESFASLPDEAQQLLMPYSRAFAATATAASRGSLTQSLAAEEELYRPLGELFERFDALVCPTWASQGLPAGDDLVDLPLPVNDEFTTWERLIMTVPFNIIGSVPVLNVPSGMAPNGIPTGVQIVGRPHDDVTTFRLGAAVEEAQDLWGSRSWRPAVSQPRRAEEVVTAQRR